MMDRIEIPISKLTKKKIFSCLELKLNNVIEVLSTRNNIFSLLTLNELHTQNKFDNYQDHFEKLLYNRKDKNISLFKGDAMYIYIACLLYEKTKKADYIDIALELVNNTQLENVYCENSLLRGYAGLILSLIILSNYIDSLEVLKKINYLVYKILDSIEYDEFGISWRELNDNPVNSVKPQNIQNLCGFGNGALGITYLFCYLSEIFDNKAFLKIVNQALLRQERLYEKEYENWPDFNHKINSAIDHKKHIQEYKNDHKAFFFQSYDNLTIDGGLIGIAFSNILIFEITGNVKQREIYYTVFYKITRLLDEKYPFTSDQIGEIGLFLLSGYGILKDLKLLLLLEKLIENIESDLTDAIKTGSSIYFYFITNCIYPTDNFIPKIESRIIDLYKDIPIVLMKTEDINKLLLKKVFNRTIDFVELSNIDFYKNITSEGHLISSFIQSVENNKKNIQDDRFEEIYELELQKYKLQNQIQSKSYYFAKGLELYESCNYLINLKLEDLLNLELVINPACKIVKLNYDWTRTIDWDFGIVKKGLILNMLENKVENVSDKTYVLLYCRNNGYIVEKPIKGYDTVLASFQEPAKVKKAFIGVLNILKPQNQEQLSQINEKIRESILLNFREGILQYN